MIRIVIADDQVMFRESLKFIIEQDNEIEVVGCAGDGKEAFDLCEKFQPDIILMNIKMPGYDGIEGTKLIKGRYENIKVIILTTYDDEESIAKALKYGVDGYVLKDTKPNDLVSAIKITTRGLYIMHKAAFEVVKKWFSYNYTEFGKRDAIAGFELTNRDITIIELVASGNSNKEIAKKLYLSEGSVKNAITRLLKKLNLKYKIELAAFAVKFKFI